METYYGFAFFIFLSLVAGLQVWLEHYRSRRRFLIPVYTALVCAAGWHGLNAVAVYYGMPLQLLIGSGVVGLVITLLWLHAAGSMLNQRVHVLVHASVLASYALLIGAAVLREPASSALWAVTNVPCLLVLVETSRRCFRGAPSGVGWLLGLLFLAYAGALALFAVQILVDGPYGGLLYFFMALLIPIQGSAFAQASMVMQSEALKATVNQLEGAEKNLRETMAEVARRESDYSRLVKNLPDIVLRADVQGRLLYASDRLCQAIDIPTDKLMGTAICDAPSFPEAARARWRRTFADIHQTGRAQQFEFSMSGSDGTTQDYRGRALPDLEGGAIRSVLVIVENVTESKRFVDALRESEARFRELFESLEDVYYKTSLDGEITEVSPSVSQWGYRREDLLGSSALAIYADPADRDRLIARLRAERSVRNVPMRLKKPNGEPLPVKWSATIVGCEPGETPRIVGILRDVSEELRLEDERAKLERQFLEAQKLESVGLLAGGVAHDFNNLLQGILGHADLLAEEAGNGKSARHLAVIIEAAQDAAALCRQLLDYSGRGHFVLSPINLSDIVWDVTELMEVGIPKPIELRIETTAKLPRIEGDSSQLRQIVVNLVKNAADAIGETAGRLTVSTGVRWFSATELVGCRGTESLEEGEYVYLRVADTGPGIGAELAPRIFDPFFSTKENGQGLGLAAVIGIVRGHSGGILVQSVPGEETSFTVLFPLVEMPAVVQSPANGRSTARGNGQLVILADDEPMVLDVAREILEARGYDVLTALNGQEAVAAFDMHRARQPLVVLDVVMPEMNGIEALRAIRERQPDTSIILASGYADLSARLTPDEAATIGLVPKPYRISELLEAIDAQNRSARG